MLLPRLNNCTNCINIPNLLKEIDCKLAEYANGLYNNITYMLNQSVPAGEMIRLIIYKRILTYKQCNPDYVANVSIQRIASRVKLLTLGCTIDPVFIPEVRVTTTTTTTSCLTTTTSSSTSTTTSTTVPPTTTTTSSSSTTSTTTIPPTTTSTTTIVHFAHGFSAGKADNLLACAETVVAITLYTSSPTLSFGSFVYTDPGLTIPFDGVGLWYKNISVNNGIRTSGIGQINSIFSC